MPIEVREDIVERVRGLCLALPEVTVRVDYPSEDSAGQAVPLLVLRAGPVEREALLAIGYPFFASRAGPDRVVVVLTGDPDWEEIRQLVTESYRILAPKKLTALLD